MKKVRNYLKRRDGTPWTHGSVLMHVADRIDVASREGKGLHLSAEEVLALDWAVIREHGYGLSPEENWRSMSAREAADEKGEEP
jgi:hypothetical protein